ncbi:hypothetical protein BDK51DRAFT_51966 [Blyttiomyces helicus]|uniref:Uncharacterized protein n=1 Tax=Blyttiomyces helicus TaxID=388810 RepID=A0A4V1IQS1_9FUNG|nr:hypothetical protein BDK51DRAFT_51966 [Blyttiomyces helicus]|eukprot:RKO87537.1 hypothetical protein BDK51DRAFT_51966 [Blyttiomyces helicus]
MSRDYILARCSKVKFFMGGPSGGSIGFLCLVEFREEKEGSTPMICAIDSEKGQTLPMTMCPIKRPENIANGIWMDIYEWSTQGLQLADPPVDRACHPETPSFLGPNELGVPRPATPAYSTGSATPNLLDPNLSDSNCLSPTQLCWVKRSSTDTIINPIDIIIPLKHNQRSPSRTSRTSPTNNKDVKRHEEDDSVQLRQSLLDGMAVFGCRSPVSQLDRSDPSIHGH